jgi:uncharacterized protein (TIGR03437 family)
VPALNALPTSVLLLIGLTARTLTGGTSLIYLPAQTAPPGSSILLPVVFQPGTDAVSGVQFDIAYDNSAMSLIATLGDGAKSGGKLIYEIDVTPGTKRFLIVGLNSSPIATGTLLNLFVNLGPNAPSAIFPLSVSNIVGTESGGITAQLAGSDGSVTVAGTIAQAVPLLAAGVLNGASLVSGPLAPGEIFTLIGSNIGSPSTKVSFDGFAASVFYVGTNQINGVAPFELAGRTNTQMQVGANNQVISALVMPVAPQSPAIFTVDGSGSGQGAILNQDSTLNSPSNPALRGTVVALFGTGSGQTNPPGVDGQTGGAFSSIPVLPVSVQIGGVDAEVLYAGTSPGLIGGLLQVNCRVPATVQPGYSVPVVLTVGTVSSLQTATLAVQ